MSFDEPAAPTVTSSLMFAVVVPLSEMAATPATPKLLTVSAVTVPLVVTSTLPPFCAKA